MKKIIIFLMLLMATFVLSGCRESCSSDNSSEFPPLIENEEYILDVESSMDVYIYEEDRRIYVRSTNPEESVRFIYNSDVLDVSEDGVITPHKSGTAIVDVVCGELSKTCTVNVLDANIIPVINLLGIENSELNIILGDSFPLAYSATMGGVELDSDVTRYTFESINSTIVEVTKEGILTAKGEGETQIVIRCEYKTVTPVEYVLDVNVVEDCVVKLSANKLVMTMNSDAKIITFEGLYKNGIKENGATTVVWSSMDENVATVNNGVITAAGNGMTYIRATYTDSQEVKEYVGYVLVLVESIRLETPMNFEFDETKNRLTWDAVLGANKYYINDGYETKTTENNYIDLNEFDSASLYFKEQKFTVYAVSNTGAEPSGRALCVAYFPSLSMTEKIVSVKDTYDASIYKKVNQDFESELDIYYAECSSTSLPGKSSIYGYLFKKVYFTSTAENSYGVNGTSGNWCKYSLINPSSPNNFSNAKMSMWVYSEEAIVIRYIKMDNNWNRTVLTEVDVEPFTWTKFIATTTSNDFPYITMLSATGGFYFTDFRISESYYELGDCPVRNVAMDEARNVIDSINTLPSVNSSTDCGDKIRAVRGMYESLSPYAKGLVSNYSILTNKEQDYANAVYATAKEKTVYKNTEALLEEYIDGYVGVTLENLKVLENSAKNITDSLNALSSDVYYSILLKSEVYSVYADKRSDYLVIDELGVGADITAKGRLWVSGGFNNIANGDSFASAKARLTDATFGRLAYGSVNMGASSQFRYVGTTAETLVG